MEENEETHNMNTNQDIHTHTNTHTHTQPTPTDNDTQKTWFQGQPETAICVQISGGPVNHATHNACHTSLLAFITTKHALKKKTKEYALNFQLVHWIIKLTMLIILQCRFHCYSSPNKKTCFQELHEKTTCVQLSSGTLNHATHNADRTSLSPSSLFEHRPENLLSRTPNTSPDTEHPKRPPSSSHPTPHPTPNHQTPTPNPTAQHTT